MSILVSGGGRHRQEVIPRGEPVPVRQFSVIVKGTNLYFPIGAYVALRIGGDEDDARESWCQVVAVRPYGQGSVEATVIPVDGTRLELILLQQNTCSYQREEDTMADEQKQTSTKETQTTTTPVAPSTPPPSNPK